MEQKPTPAASTDYPEHVIYSKKRFKEECDITGVEAFDAHYPQWLEEKLASANAAKGQEDADALIFDSNKQSDLVVFNNIDAFAAHLVAWHQRQKAQVDQVMQVPDGQPMQVNMPDGTVRELKLTGDTLFAFQSGVSVVMSLFGNLPFQAIPQETKDEPSSEDPN